MVANPAESLIATVRDSSSTQEDINAAAQSFFDAISGKSVEEAHAAMAQLSDYFDFEDSSRGAFLALVCGAMVESGCDPSVISQPLIKRIASLLESSVALAEACAAEMPEPEERDDEDEEDDDNDEDLMETFEKVRAQIAARMPKEDDAWEALGNFWQPAIAVFSASPESRAAARPLKDMAGEIADYHEAGHWLQLMLTVLDNEPMVVIEPSTQLGILARISGVVDNFQLNTLLMDAFPKSGLMARRRVSQRVAEVARGNGPQQTDDTVTSVWNLYNWQAIESDFSLPDPDDYGSSQFWIWNEGTPEDIAVFDDRRAVLLGPPSYPRSWGSQRMFDGLPANLEIEQKLSKEEVKDWLSRMVAAKSGE